MCEFVLSHLWDISVRSHLHWKTGTKCLCVLTGRCWRSWRVVHLSAAGILQFVFGVAARGSTVQWQRDIWQHSSQDSCLCHALSKHLTAELASFHAISYQYLITFHCLQLLTDKWKTWIITLLRHVTNDSSLTEHKIGWVRMSLWIYWMTTLGTTVIIKDADNLQNICTKWGVNSSRSTSIMPVQHSSKMCHFQMNLDWNAFHLSPLCWSPHNSRLSLWSNLKSY